MKLLDLTLSDPAGNLALDEALLEQAERSVGHSRDESDGEILRLWESPCPMVVVGRSSRVAAEVDLAACAADNVPIFRRDSGGAAIVAGPGCLMYALILDCRRRPALRAIVEAHRFVLERVAAALSALTPGIEHRGTSDLAIEGRKFSGNSLRAKRDHILYHGTLLYDFPLELIGRYLCMPSRQPDYRDGRSHGDFIANLPVGAAALRTALTGAFDAEEPIESWPRELVTRNVAERYSRRAWNFRL